MVRTKLQRLLLSSQQLCQAKQSHQHSQMPYEYMSNIAVNLTHPEPILVCAVTHMDCTIQIVQFMSDLLKTFHLAMYKLSSKASFLLVKTCSSMMSFT